MSPAPQGTVYCSECGQPTTAGELARFGDRLVCASCKNAYAQKLREGAVQAPAAVYAGFWIRFVAYLIDAVILGVVGIIIQTAIVGSALTLPRPLPGSPISAADLGVSLGLIGLASLINMVLGGCYEGFFLSRFGATPGKMVLGLRVVRPDGTRLSFGRAFGRFFAKALSGLILCIGYIMIAFDSQKRGLHDMICETRVIKSRD